MVMLALSDRGLAADTARELEKELAYLDDSASFTDSLGFGDSSELNDSAALASGSESAIGSVLADEGQEAGVLADEGQETEALADEGQDSELLAARTYREAEEMLQHLEAWVNLENYVILLLILLIGTIGIVNIIVLSALERTREIGIMKAMGLKEKEIVRIFSLEAGGIGLFGGLLGCLLGAFVVGLLAWLGLDIRLIYGDALDGIGIPMTGRLYGVWNQASFILIFLFVLLLTVIASLLPSFWAARKDPIEAIYER